MSNNSFKNRLAMFEQNAQKSKDLNPKNSAPITSNPAPIGRRQFNSVFIKNPSLGVPGLNKNTNSQNEIRERFNSGYNPPVGGAGSIEERKNKLGMRMMMPGMPMGMRQPKEVINENPKEDIKEFPKQDPVKVQEDNILNKPIRKVKKKTLQVKFSDK